jgi:2OG-Fe(II) oxygenase superfamily
VLREDAFRYFETDVKKMFPPGWWRDVSRAVEKARFCEFPPTPIISREALSVSGILRGRVAADVVKRDVPWLCRLYESEILDLARTVAQERVFSAQDSRYGIVLNVQHGGLMRFECHVDSNPLTGILFLSDHDEAAGGELVISSDSRVRGVAEIEEDCISIQARVGKLIFFDGRRNPHYVRPLRTPSATRISAVMNFYTESFPESTRPTILNRHLFGDAG